jgi:phosphosulfolactate synthase
MNFQLTDLPKREEKPRSSGLTMVMDKGLSISEVNNLIESSGHFVDLIKLGFGTSLITPMLEKKLALYREAGMQVYLGGTLFEAFLVRGKLEEYISMISDLGLKYVEVSDGSIELEHKLKCKIIQRLAASFTVLSEVGSKEEGILIHPSKWISMMNRELEAGAWRVIAEARESGNVGIYHRDGKTHVMLVDRIISKVQPEKILWEAPQKNQQVWFIKYFGANVNLGNIAPTDVIPLETLRLGLRGDTFFTFIGSDKKQAIKKI